MVVLCLFIREPISSNNLGGIYVTYEDRLQNCYEVMYFLKDYELPNAIKIIW